MQEIFGFLSFISVVMSGRCSDDKPLSVNMAIVRLFNSVAGNDILSYRFGLIVLTSKPCSFKKDSKKLPNPSLSAMMSIACLLQFSISLPEYYFGFLVPKVSINKTVTVMTGII